MVFWRIYDNNLYSIEETKSLGFSSTDPSFIPDEYLNNQNFIILRSAFGIGDQGIISSMPRLLKQKYPNCKIYIPSLKLLEKLFGNIKQNWGSWGNPLENVKIIFENNPYIDGEIDEVSGDIFHDHFRIYDEKNVNVPLVQQMLKFWQFEPHEMEDYLPELYFSVEEKELGDKIIKEHVGNQEFGSLLISNRYDFTQDKIIIDLLKENNLPYFYYSSKPLHQTDFNFINKALDINHIPTRIQLYIRSKAKINIGNHCGVLDCVSRYSNTYTVQRQYPPKHNFLSSENYVGNKWKRDLLKKIPDKYESKTTTSLKWKSDLIDFFSDDKYKNMNVLEVGSSLGASTHILSHLFREVTALDNLAIRHEKSKELNKNRDNIIYKVMDVYSQQWDFENMDVVFIDCVHDYQHVKQDINNSIINFDNPILVFDDYGLFPEIKKEVDEYIEEGKLKRIKKIGHYPGNVFPKTQYKILKDREGLICSVIK